VRLLEKKMNLRQRSARKSYPENNFRQTDHAAWHYPGNVSAYWDSDWRIFRANRIECREADATLVLIDKRPDKGTSPTIESCKLHNKDWNFKYCR